MFHFTCHEAFYVTLWLASQSCRNRVLRTTAMTPVGWAIAQTGREYDIRMPSVQTHGSSCLTIFLASEPCMLSCEPNFLGMRASAKRLRYALEC